MDVLIVSRKTIIFWALCGILVACATFSIGYFVGKQQSRKTSINIENIMPKDDDINVLPSKGIDATVKDSTNKKKPKDNVAVSIKTDGKTKQVKNKSANKPNKTTKKKIEKKTAVTKPTAATKKDAAIKTTAKDSSDNPEIQKGYAIQVGSFGNQKNAERYLTKLIEKGYEAYIHKEEDKKKRYPLSVRIGFFRGYNRAMEEAKTFAAVEKRKTMVVPTTVVLKDESIQ